METNGHQDRTTAGRRAVLGAGAAGAALLLTPAARAGAATSAPAGTSAPTAAAGTQAGALRVTSRGGYRQVLGARASTQAPTGLGFVARGALPPGVEVRVEHDARLYQAAATVKLRRDGGAVERVPASSGIGAGHRAWVAFVVPAGVTRELVVDAGSTPRRIYPDDLVDDVLPVVVTIGTGRAATAVTLAPVQAAGARTAAGRPWGARLGAAWAAPTAEGPVRPACPEMVTLHSVGPGAVPAGSVVRVRLDGRVATDATLRPLGGEGSGGTLAKAGGQGRLEVSWRLTEPLAAGRRLSLLLDVVRASASGGTGSDLEPTLVWLEAPQGASATQRFTGLESLSGPSDLAG